MITMTMEIKINEKNYKYVMALVVGGIIALIVFIILTFSSNKRQQQAGDQTQIKDQLSSIVGVNFPYSTNKYTIFYNESAQMFIVEYPGYYSQDEIEVNVISWMKSNLDGQVVRVKFGGIGEEPRNYDLSKEIFDILPNNPLVKKASEDSGNDADFAPNQ